MTCRVDSTLIAGACIVGNRGLGELGAAIRAATATGTHGPGYLYNDLTEADDAKEVRGLIVTPPAAGTFAAEEDGAFTLTGAPDGAYSFVYRLFADGADLGTATATLTIGAPTYASSGGAGAVVTITSGGGGTAIGGADTTLPVHTGSIVASAITSTGYTITIPAATDNVGVAGYEYAINGGAYVSMGLSLTVSITGRTPGATDTVTARAFDAAGNRSTPALSTTVTLSTAATPPTVVTQPSAASAVEGGTVSLSAAFAGSPTPTLQWYRNGAPISGATSGAYSFTAALADNGSSFFCRASNSAGSADSATVVVSVTALPGSLQPPPTGPGFYSRPRRTVYLGCAEQEVPDLSPMVPGDTITLAFDFAPYTSASSPAIVVDRQGGDDGQDGVEAVGAHYVTGAMVLQRFTAPLTALGSTYRVSCRATVGTGDTLTLTGRLPVRLR